MVKVVQSQWEEAQRAEADAPSAPLLAPTSPMRAVSVMTGTHFHALDEKGRVIIPAKLRPALTEQFWILLNGSDNIAFYNHSTWLDVMAYSESLTAQRPGDLVLADSVRRIAETAEKVVVEGNWRVQIPDYLRLRAQLDKEVVTVGVLNHAVLWDRQRWEQAQEFRPHSQEVRRTQDEILRAAASGRILKSRASESDHPQRVLHGQEQYEEVEGAPSANFAADVEAGAGLGSSGARGRTVAAAASASDGKRSSRVLTLSQIGR